MKTYLASLTMLLLPAAAHAQQDLQVSLLMISMFINNILIPLLFSIAFLVFLWNAARYFIIGGSDPAGREQAKMFALWSIIAFVLMVSIWGIVNMLVSSFGLGSGAAPCPDYLSDC